VRSKLQRPRGTIDAQVIGRTQRLDWRQAIGCPLNRVAWHIWDTPLTFAPSAESWIRKAVVERGFTPGLVGFADAKAEDEAASRWADCAVASGD
jgi:hypothetical protein